MGLLQPHFQRFATKTLHSFLCFMLSTTHTPATSLLSYRLSWCTVVIRLCILMLPASNPGLTILSDLPQIGYPIGILPVIVTCHISTQLQLSTYQHTLAQTRSR